MLPARAGDASIRTGVPMFHQLLVGAAASIVTIAIHAVVMAAVVRITQVMGVQHTSRPMQRLIGVMIASVLVLMAAHCVEVLVWALTYWLVEAAPAKAGLIYFAFVNYTTLGYGDVTPVERWQLLGPITAMNGVLMFGWSTAVIFEVLRRTVAQSSDRRA